MLENHKVQHARNSNSVFGSAKDALENTMPLLWRILCAGLTVAKPTDL